MRSTTLAALTLTTLALAACGGQQPAPQPPPSAPLPMGTASAAAPPAETTPPPPPKPSLADLIPQTMKGLTDAANAHDAKKFASYFAEDDVLFAYGDPEVQKGRDGVTKMMTTVFDFAGDFKSAVTRVWTKGNVAVVEIVWSGTMANDFMGIKASKKPIGQTRLHVMWFNDDGLIKEEHEYGDGAGLTAQMKGAKGAPPVPTVPTSPTEMHAAKGTPDEDKLADWAKGLDETFSKDDVKLAVSTVADDGDYWLNISGMPATKGKKDLTKELTSWFKTFPDQKWSPTSTWGVDGFAIVEHTVSGTQKGAMGPLAASNKPVTNWHFVDILQPTADGKTQHGWGYANLVEMMMQTGAIKPPAEKAPKADAAKGAPKTDKDKDKGDATKGNPPKADAPKADKKMDMAKEPEKKK
jgi:uncharacterized protein (TIGR02246 family)